MDMTCYSQLLCQPKMVRLFCMCTLSYILVGTIVTGAVAKLRLLAARERKAA